MSFNLVDVSFRFVALSIRTSLRRSARLLVDGGEDNEPRGEQSKVAEVGSPVRLVAVPGSATIIR